jgi:hypothetical protein
MEKEKILPAQLKKGTQSISENIDQLDVLELYHSSYLLL